VGLDAGAALDGVLDLEDASFGPLDVPFGEFDGPDVAGFDLDEPAGGDGEVDLVALDTQAPLLPGRVLDDAALDRGVFDEDDLLVDEAGVEVLLEVVDIRRRSRRRRPARRRCRRGRRGPRTRRATRRRGRGPAGCRSAAGG